MQVGPDTELSSSELLTLSCGVLFFFSFFVAMYVEVKAEFTIYQVCSNGIIKVFYIYSDILNIPLTLPIYLHDELSDVRNQSPSICRNFWINFLSEHFLPRATNRKFSLNEKTCELKKCWQ